MLVILGEGEVFKQYNDFHGISLPLRSNARLSGFFGGRSIQNIPTILVFTAAGTVQLILVH
jgi:hypothetical protein